MGQSISRNFFLKQVGCLAAGYLFFPKWLLPEASARRPVFKSQDLGIVDLHCHPSLKMYLWERDMRRHHHPGRGDNEFNQQIDIYTLEEGYVKGMVASHYLVEASVATEWNSLKAAFWGIKNLFPKLQDKLEHGDYSNFTQINVMIDILENQVHLVNQYLKTEKFIIARNFREYKAAIDKGQIPIAHAIEGAHALGRDKPVNASAKSSYKPIVGKMQESAHTVGSPVDASKYILNLEALKLRGVCLITIAHLFENDIAYPCEGIAVNEKHSLKMSWSFDPGKNNFELKPVGEEVVKAMLDLGIIVDLTHSTPAIRKQVFKINNDRGDRKRPLTFTHVGSREMFDRYDNRYNRGANKNYGFYCVDKEEIEAICACNGVIGVVFENFWLTGCNRQIDKHDRKTFSQVIPFIIETILDINSKTNGNFNNIAIGSDFDGFAYAESDLYKPPQLKDLIDAMKKYPAHAFTDEEIRKIFSLNALRLLEEGWV